MRHKPSLQMRASRKLPEFEHDLGVAHLREGCLGAKRAPRPRTAAAGGPTTSASPSSAAPLPATAPAALLGTLRACFGTRRPSVQRLMQASFPHRQGRHPGKGLSPTDGHAAIMQQVRGDFVN